MKKAYLVVLIIIIALTNSGMTKNRGTATVQGRVAVGEKKLNEKTIVCLYASPNFNKQLVPDDKGYYEAVVPMDKNGTLEITIFARITYASCTPKFITEKRKVTLHNGDLFTSDFIYETAVIQGRFFKGKGIMEVRNEPFEDYFQCTVESDDSGITKLVVPAGIPLMVRGKSMLRENSGKWEKICAQPGEVHHFDFQENP